MEKADKIVVVDYSDLAVGVVVYDEVSRIKQLVYSFRKLDSFDKIQWVFVLNHQDFDIRTLIKNYLIRLVPSAVCIENSCNNIAIARNLILQQSRTPWIYFTDPDIDHFFSSLSLLFEQTSQSFKFKTIVGFGGPIHYKSTHFTIQKTYDFFSDLMRYLPFSFLIQNHPRKRLVDHVPTCHMLVNRQLSLQAGGFNPNYAQYGEDLEFTHRLSNLGFSFLFIPDAKVLHWQNLSYSKHLYKMFCWGRVQITSNYDHCQQGIRWYRLIPLLFILIALLISLSFPFTLSLIVLTLGLCSFFYPGFSGAFLSLTAYALGELFQLICLLKNRNNVVVPREIESSFQIKQLNS